MSLDFNKRSIKQIYSNKGNFIIIIGKKAEVIKANKHQMESLIIMLTDAKRNRIGIRNLFLLVKALVEYEIDFV